MADPTRVLVIVPTHNHSSTLGVAVESVFSQTFADLEVAIIGDGVGDDTRQVAHELVRRDGRVRFYDLPKSPSRAERARHKVIMASDANVVTYLGDDDLFLRDHVAEMVKLLHRYDFVHPFPICIDADDELVAHPTDLSDPRCVRWHLQPSFNTIGLTGVAHTVEIYRRLPHGWVEPPPGRWSDHYFWGQIFKHPGARPATSTLATVIKLPSEMRLASTPDEKRLALERWASRAMMPGFAAEWDRLVAEAIRKSAVTNHMWTTLHHQTITELQKTLDATAVELAAITSTRTWRFRMLLIRSALFRRSLARRSSRLANESQ